MNGSQCLERESKCGNGSALMPKQTNTMPVLELKVYIRVVAAVFAEKAVPLFIYLYFWLAMYSIYYAKRVSAATAFVFALLRVLNSDLFYTQPLVGKDVAIHYFVSGLMLVASGIGFLNSCVVMNRSAAKNCGRNVTTWLLLDSLFETSRVVYVFMFEIVFKSRGPLHMYDLLISIAQYLLDSFLYCQMILRH